MAAPKPKAKQPTETQQEGTQENAEQRPEGSDDQSPVQDQTAQPAAQEVPRTQQEVAQELTDALDKHDLMPTNQKKLGLEENPVYAMNFLDDEGSPAGGVASGIGISVYFQNGPINRDAGEGPNGAFIEQLLETSAERLRFYQESPFACEENASALAHIEEALYHLYARRKDRVRRGVLGQHVS